MVAGEVEMGLFVEGGGADIGITFQVFESGASEIVGRVTHFDGTGSDLLVGALLGLEHVLGQSAADGQFPVE